MDRRDRQTLLKVADLREYFRDALQAAIRRQRFSLHHQTEHYVVNLLALFARSEALYEDTPDGPRLKPLALMLAEAMEAPRQGDRARMLQRMGDVSLFIAGVFAESFARRLVDVDYHIAMGGRAYGSAADIVGSSARGRALASVFAELAGKFQRLVDALNEVASGARSAEGDILRLYEIWLKTGSPLAREQLLQLGVRPVAVSREPNH